MYRSQQKSLTKLELANQICTHIVNTFISDACIGN